MTSEYHLQQRSFIFVVSFAVLISSSGSFRIYDNLIHCYRGNETQPWIGNSMRVLIELIEKIEQQMPTNIDIRTLSANIFHQLRLDGIERTPGVLENELVTPYRATGIHVYKFDLLRNLISHTSQKINFEQYLTQSEICNLHKLISVGVEPYIRGDEVRTCPVKTRIGNGPSRPDPFNRNRPHVNVTYIGGPKNPTVLSPCPLEKGVTRTFEFGSLTAGTLIGGIAAGLQPQNVQLNELVSAHIKFNPYENLETMEPKDTRREIEKLFNSRESIDNTYAVGLSGDIAEVCVYQSPLLGTNVTVGMSGQWNSTYFPRWRYLPDTHQTRWEMTDAEILADIDSYFISNHINSWVNRIHGLRLSQILQMFYSHQYGIPSITIENSNHNKNDLAFNVETESQQNSNHHNNKNNNNNGKKKSEAIQNDVEEIDVDFVQSRILEFNNKVERFQKYVNEISSADGINRACHRKAILQTIDIEKLKEETYRFAQILQYTATSSIVDELQMRRVCDSSVDKFMVKASELVRETENCKLIIEEFKIPSVDLTLVIDGSRPMYENMELIFHITEILQLSPRGSHFSLIHGMTGQYMVNHPVRLSLSNVLLKLIEGLANQTVAERESHVFAAPAQVLLVVSQGVRMSQVIFLYIYF
uniref:CSON010782 protein n=1 Tax=Culicoides sonorensis TaxID=179676 RepID=A0A336MZV1_CULSO